MKQLPSRWALRKQYQHAARDAQIEKCKQMEAEIESLRARVEQLEANCLLNFEAYDEVTEQLHVGTSSGRSDFRGLRRINNTTTAVTTAISAHDGFIIEQ